jgi:hypothetical protein
VLLLLAYVVKGDRLPFHPRQYPKQIATCKALKGDNGTVDIDIRTAQPFVAWVE